MKNVLIQLVIILFIAACASKLPPPTTNNPTLLVVYSEIKNDSSIQPFVSYNLTINPSDATLDDVKNSKIINLEAKAGLSYFSGFKPGNYIVTKIQSYHERGGIGSEQEGYLVFEVKDNQISFFPKKLVIELTEIQTERTTQRYGFVDLSSEDRSTINNLLQKEENFRLWKK